MPRRQSLPGFAAASRPSWPGGLLDRIPGGETTAAPLTLAAQVIGPAGARQAAELAGQLPMPAAPEPTGAAHHPMAATIAAAVGGTIVPRADHRDTHTNISTDHLTIRLIRDEAAVLAKTTHPNYRTSFEPVMHCTRAELAALARADIATAGAFRAALHRGSRAADRLAYLLSSASGLVPIGTPAAAVILINESTGEQSPRAFATLDDAHAYAAPLLGSGRISSFVFRDETGAYRPVSTSTPF